MKLLNAEGALGTIVVFAAGNDGWNSATGEIPVFDRHLSGEDIHGYLKSRCNNPNRISGCGFSPDQKNWHTFQPAITN
jgi:hypothetical protein